jgi:hypothetical protein
MLSDALTSEYALVYVWLLTYHQTLPTIIPLFIEARNEAERYVVGMISTPLESILRLAAYLVQIQHGPPLKLK